MLPSRGRRFARHKRLDSKAYAVDAQSDPCARFLGRYRQRGGLDGHLCSVNGAERGEKTLELRCVQ